MLAFEDPIYTKCFLSFQETLKSLKVSLKKAAKAKNNNNVKGTDSGNGDDEATGWGGFDDDIIIDGDDEVVGEDDDIDTAAIDFSNVEACAQVIFLLPSLIGFSASTSTLFEFSIYSL